MITVKNEVFIGLLHENSYLMNSELTFGWVRKSSWYDMNEHIFG